MSIARTLIQVHYHARMGGVSVVMSRYARAFEELRGRGPGANIVVCSPDQVRQRLPWPSVTRVDLPDCAYRAFRSGASFERVRARLRRRLEEVCRDPGLAGPICVVGHNLTLGKNLALTAAFADVARECAEVNFVSVVHDLAEEGRIDMLRRLRSVSRWESGIRQLMYPTLPNYRYVVLNRRLHRLFRGAGLDAGLLFNPVASGVSPEGGWISRDRLWEALTVTARRDGVLLDRAKPVVFYPVRILGRKNVAEAVLVACLLGGANLLVGGPGSSARDRRFMERLRTLCVRRGLPALFDVERARRRLGRDVGGGRVFPHLYHFADVCISTAVTEGFGYALYEPWAYGKAVCGRVPVGFSFQGGIEGGGLYRVLPVPMEWIDAARLARTYYRYMGECFPGQWDGATFEGFREDFERTVIKKGLIDFAMLDQDGQLTVLDRLAAAGNVAEPRVLRRAWGGTVPAGPEETFDDRGRIDRNRRRVLRHLSEPAFRRAFQRQVLRGRPSRHGHQVDTGVFMKYFHTVRRFRLLRASGTTVSPGRKGREIPA